MSDERQIPKKPITKREAYRLGFYRSNPPPVPTAGWNEDAWIRYIGNNWTVPVREDDAE